MPDRRELVERFASMADGRQALAFLLGHPVLVTDAVLNDLHGLVKAEGGEGSAHLRPFRALASFANTVDEDPSRYPLGAGPIEQLARRAEAGVAPAELARQATAEEVAGLLGARYVNALCGDAIRQADEGRWREAVLPLQLLLAACEAPACAPEDGPRIRFLVRRAWVTLVTRAITDVPDPRLYCSARDAGARGLAELGTGSAGEAERGLLHFAVGVLHLDPWIEPRGQSFQNGMAMWWQRFVAEAGPLLAALPEEERVLPSPEEALALAEPHLRVAGQLGPPLDRAKGLKALAQLRAFRRETLGAEVDAADIAAPCREALALLGSESPRSLVLAVQAYLARYDQPAPPSGILTAADLPARRRVKTDAEVAAEVLQAIQVYPERDPAAVDLVLAAGQLFEGDVGDHQRLPFYQLAIRRLRELTDPIPPERLHPGRLRQDLESMRAEAGPGRGPLWHDGLLLRLAFMASGADAEEEALELLAGVGFGEELARRLPALIGYVEAVLAQNAGATAVARGALASGVAHYGRAARAFFTLGLETAGMGLLDRIEDLAARPAEPGILNELTIALGRLTPYLEHVHGDAGSWRVHTICQKAFAAMDRGSLHEGFFLLRQVSKGYRFACSLASAQRYDWRGDARAVAQLERIAAEEASAAGAEAPRRELDDDWLLLAYTRRGPVLAGASPAERLVNLRQAFDAYLGESTLAAAADVVPIATADEVRAWLDDETVLADLVLTPAGDGTAELRWMVFTRQAVRSIITRHASPHLQVLLGSDLPVAMDSFGLWVARVREAVRTATQRPQATPEALQVLERDLRTIFGDGQWLDELRAAGKTRLVLVPHGPFHYYPLHLVATSSGLLADGWTVSYLPNLHLLARPRPPAEARPPRGGEVLAVGLEYTDFSAPGLPMLPAAAGEARLVAEVLGAKPLLEREATRKAILERLPASRLVHIAAHGSLDVDAPAYQCIWTAPDEADGPCGRLLAYELLGLDLRRVQLATLSACETGLGRFDLADNLRGFPAALLQAGVQRLVVSLWPVSSSAAAAFFIALYREVAAGIGVPEAFSRAQQRTQEAHPAYRDWGPFVLVG